MNGQPEWQGRLSLRAAYRALCVPVGCNTSLLPEASWLLRGCGKYRLFRNWLEFNLNYVWKQHTFLSPFCMTAVLISK